MTINTHSLDKRHFYLLNLLFCLPFLFGCANKNKKIDPHPIKSFVQIWKTVHVDECKPNTPCKTGSFSSVGSGGVISHSKGFTLILTAAHVCTNNFSKQTQDIISKKRTEIKIRNWKGEYYSANVLRVSDNKKIDLCAVYIVSPGEIMPKLKTTKIRPYSGETVSTMAAPLGIYHPPTVPILSGRWSGYFSDEITAMVTIPSQPGSSGALVLNKDHEIVAVIYAVSPLMNHITLAVGQIETNNFVKKTIRIFNSESGKLPIPIQVIAN